MALVDQRLQRVGGLAVLVDGGVEPLGDESLVTSLGEGAGGVVLGLGPSADTQLLAQLQLQLYEAGQFPAGFGARLLPSEGLIGWQLVVLGWLGRGVL